MKNSILILLLIAALGPSCIKEIQIPFIPVPKMKTCPWPAISTEGNATMGFKINRQNWVPCVSLNFYGIQGVEGSLRESDGSNRLWLRGFYSINGVDTSSTLDIKLSPLKTGLIQPETLDLLELRFHISSNLGLKTKTWRLTDHSQLLYLEILRLDTAKNIIAGRMAARLLSESGQDTLRLEDGRFDLHYSAY
ncbi:MAG: hypothetical protein R3D58_18460 [Saprospiraceae bacterium]